MMPAGLRIVAASAFASALIAGLGAAAAPAATAAAATCPGAVRLQPQTCADLMQSMRGEAFAHAFYTYAGAQAQRAGKPAAASLFERTAGVELGEHFLAEARLACLARSDVANLRDAIAGEGYEARVMYPGFAQAAASAGDTAAASLFTEISRDEAAHRAAFRAALHVLTSGRGTIPAPPGVTRVPVPAGLPQVSSPQTLANLSTAMHGEAFAYAKYTAYALHARAHGHRALARLFAGTASVELMEHFAAEAVLAGLIGTTRANLTTAITGERYESRVMYPLFARRARAAGDFAAAILFRHNAADEARHAREFERALAGKQAEQAG